MIKAGFSVEGNNYICNKGHEFVEVANNMKIREYRASKGKTTYSDLCPICKFDNYISGVREQLTSFGFDLLSNIPADYDPRNTLISIRCKKGHIEERKMEYIRSSPQCNKCRLSAGGWFETTKSLGIPLVEKTGVNRAKLLLPSGLVEMTIRQISERFVKDPYDIFGYTRGELREEDLRSERSKYRTSCSQGHIFETSRRYLLEGHGCRLCSLSQINEPERIIGSWIGDMGIAIVRRDDSVIDEELDIYVPDRKVAIEYCGIRWHSMENAGTVQRKSKEKRLLDFPYKHQRKTLLAAQHGIHLITIFESDFLHNREYIKNIVLDAITGVTPDTKDLRFRKLLPDSKYSEPKALFFDRSYRQLDEPDFARYTVYDCGHLVE